MFQEQENKFGFAQIATIILAVVLGGFVVVEVVTQNVIRKLERDYSPSPYGPKFDPDKIDIDKFAKN